MQLARIALAPLNVTLAQAVRTACVALMLLVAHLPSNFALGEDPRAVASASASDEQKTASRETASTRDPKEALYLAGTMGVGTWNTTAEFRNFQYQIDNQTSLLSDAINAWNFSAGQWRIVGEGVRCDQSASPALARIGKAAERFTITLRARKLGGKEGFLIAFGSVPGGGRSWLNLGGFGNSKHVLQMPVRDKAEVAGSIQPQRWYDVKIEIAGTNVQCFLDGDKVLEATTATIMDPTVQFGLGAWETQVEYDAISIIADGKSYYNGNFPGDHSRWIRTETQASKLNRGPSAPNKKRASNEHERDKTLRLTDVAQPAFAILGRNDTFSLQAMKTGGQEGFLVLLGTDIHGDNSWWNIGGFGNTRHVLDLPGVGTTAVPGKIEQGKWYDIRVERNGLDVRCYLNNQLLHDTSRMIDQVERQIRFERLLACEGAELLLPAETEQLDALGKRSVFIGEAAQRTFQSVPSLATVSTLTPIQQRDLVRGVNRHRLTWSMGWGFEPVLDKRQKEILDSIDEAVCLYNSIGVFEKHVTANNSPGTPTADANFEGSIRFGRSFNSRVALHELGHCMGVGTHPRWGRILEDGKWTGRIANELVKQFDGPEAMLKGDRMHMWPYGLNFDHEDGGDARRRHVLMVAAVRRDMGFHKEQWIHYATDIPEGKYWLAARSEPKMLLTANAKGSGKSEPAVISEGTRSKFQQFMIKPQENGTYAIQTVGTRGGVLGVTNGRSGMDSTVGFATETRQSTVGWYIIPLGDGYYKISPHNNLELGLTVEAKESQRESAVGLSAFTDSFSQQWQLVPITSP